MISAAVFLFVLCVLLQYVTVSTVDVSPTKCKLPDNSEGTCVNLKYCPAAITAKTISECYKDGDEQIVCCKNDLWSEFKSRPLTADCNIPEFEIIKGLQTQYKEYPYMVALGWDSTFSTEPYEYKCGGVLIATNYVLTAAHCALLNGLSPSVVLVGGNNLTDSSNKPLKIIEVIKHPEYKPKESYHDIALLKLEEQAREEPICAWSLYPMDDVNVTAIGYGHTQFAGAGSESLLKTHLSIVPNKDCALYFSQEASLPYGIAENQLCAKDFVRNSDTCQGDSGGPLILHSTNRKGVKKPFVVGVTSFGQGCAMDPPGIYTRVSEYIDWIEGILFKTPTN